ncbi:MAG: ornithine carbamoyltransferase, partial [Desulfobacula sp.]
AASVLDLDLTVACPDGFGIDTDIIKAASADQKSHIRFTHDPREAVKNADVVYTDVWASMGDEGELSKRIEVFKGFQVNKDLLSLARKDVLVMHCLPAHRGEEISEDVLENKNSVFWDQAENKRHMHKAILEKLILKN